ncbi:MAG TPA: DNA translocase FtsK 4TM domain-containing protein [Candidatus Contendobacter sp.]|nr:DNA translocase FtsK 4TM domain-containing protein [Candidatus Contendobacter sp.]MDS4058489.1 DNA translocase FtsK 4TM domain-containing protein [Candidatus Contendobacter sp.]HRD48941.1 DNA translocase FtsK 4TM domain-containing protein [Candidatus Contendobacter sp.]
MAQAHRIKTEPPAIRVGLLRFVKGVLREIGFWLLAAIALGMMIALATFNPEDPAWTHTANVSRFHNLGGVIGAWFADVNLYFFGYPAYLLPLGMIFGGWRLFMRGALLELDGEIVLLRVLGFVVTLTMACGLAALHLHPAPGTVPGAGSAGGLVGIHASQFLTHAFEFAGGNLFMLCLLLAGVTLATGFSWLTLLDGVGQAALKAVGWIGALVMAPLRRARPEAGADGSGNVDPAVEAAPGSDAEAVAPAVRTNPDRGFRPVVAWPLAWWRAWRTHTTPAVDPAAVAAAMDSVPLSIKSPAPSPADPAPAIETESLGGRNPARIEPIFNLSPNQEPPRPELSVTDPMLPAPPVWELPAGSEILTLVPTVTPNRAAAAPIPSISPVPWTQPAAEFDADEKMEEEASPSPPVSPPVSASQRLTVSPVPAASPDKAAGARRPVTPPAPVAPYPLPPLDLLDRPPARTAGYSPETLEQMSRRVETRLKDFGIEVKVVAVEPGPVITRFEIDPAPGVKVSQISNLSKDLARGLSVVSVRVVEIIPGKSVIGLEIPNQHREVVYLREVLEAPIYTQSASPLTLALGKDIGGNPVVANLGKMPHLLVAGTTGSGKSVAINAMLLSLLYKAPPREVRLILVDPKMLELSMYEDIPHLLTPVVTDMKEAANALRWCVGEMERRYRLMAALKVRNIAGFNRKLSDAQAVGEGISDPFWKPGDAGAWSAAPLLEPLPFIVVVIDELADMMMVVGKKVEELIARLAQKARAAGIHLILATQRPSVDVITGLIKANIPTRIAFQVSSRVDSRTILDQMGAEQLLGHGDMLYLPPGTGLPQRAHGAFVDDHEVTCVVDYLRQTGAPDYMDEVLAGPSEDSSDGGDEAENGGGRGGESDPLYDEAVRIVTESRRASVSGVQRRLRIGYNRAARLVEEMETAGVVGSVQPNGSREVLAPPP